MKKNTQKKIIKVSLILILFSLFLFSSVGDTEARQGCCSHHGGVCTYKCSDGINVGYCCCDGSSLSATCAPYYASCPIVFTPPPKLELPKTDYTTLATASAEVTRVVDGDTIEVKFTDGTIEKVRLIGIDTPETVHPSKPVECFGKEASIKMTELVEGKNIKLERKAEENRGSYGRLLRYVYVDDLFVNAEMIKQGYAYAYTKYPFDSDLMENFRQYEKDAREKMLGLWSPNACAGIATPIALENNKGENDDQPLSDLFEETENSQNIKETNNSGWEWILGIGAIIAIIGSIMYSAHNKKI